MKRVLITVFLLACTSKSHESPAPQPPAKQGTARGIHVAPELLASGRIRTAPVVRKDPSGNVRLAADVVAGADGTAEAGTLLPGRVSRFEAVEGDTVKRGQVLAWLEAPEAARDVADLIRARTRTDTLGRKVARLEGLRTAEAVTQLALEEARLELDLARADLNAARTLCASLGIPEPSGAGAPTAVRLPVRSPVDGVIVERSSALGAHVAPDARIFRIMSAKHVVIEARVPDGLPLAFAPNVPARVFVRETSTCTAQVLGLLPLVDQATRTQKVRLTPSDACSGLLPGSQVEVEVTVAGVPNDARPLVVPTASVVDIKTAKFVFTKAPKDGSFELRAIEPGMQLGSDLVVTTGVAEGEDVVVDGMVLLKGELLRAELEGEQ
ncbi:MAG: efflux RND transporter periplasmic adaptor subunit [Polyangiaceae bacterium]